VEQVLHAFCDCLSHLAITIVELYWIHMLLNELHISFPTVLITLCDNSGVLVLASNHMFHARIKYIEIDFHFIHKKKSGYLLSIYKFL
jgi:hypothetical protein